MKRCVFLWQNHNNSDCFDKDIVLKQYEEALNLYKHEDLLNWSKINHYFYTTGGMLAILSLWSTLNINFPFAYYLAVISLFGIGLSWLFFISLKNGVYYLQERKHAAVKAERLLIKMRGIDVISVNDDPQNTNLKRSSTTKVMKMITLIGFSIWFVIFFVCIIILIMK